MGQEQITQEEWDKSFELFHNAVMRGTEMYRKIHPEYSVMSHPDTGKMVEALCDRILFLEKLNDEIYQKCIAFTTTCEQLLDNTLKNMEKIQDGIKDAANIDLTKTIISN